MWPLLIATILTSAADSLNPIGITQQFALQGMVKKPRHIWFFILTTGIVNLIAGYLAYYGFTSFIGDFLSKSIEKYGQILFTAELILGIAFLIAVSFLLQNRKIEALKKQIKALQPVEHNNLNAESESVRKIKSVTPIALIAFGIGATISELTSALPYFAFLAILFNYQLTFLQVTPILVLYNIIYMLPLMILYFVYVVAKDKFDRLYLVIKSKITKWSNILVPTLMGAVGVALIYHSLSLLIS